MAVASVLLGAGALLLSAGAAAASSLAGATAVITFWNNDNVVTLNVPSMCPNPGTSCEWMLSVNEPDIPAQTLVGTAVGTSGILTVPYPSNFCGVIQADVLVGPPPWRLVVGHQEAIQNGNCNCPTQSSSTSSSSSNSTSAQTSGTSSTAPSPSTSSSAAAPASATAGPTVSAGWTRATRHHAAQRARHRDPFPGRQTVAEGSSSQSTTSSSTSGATGTTTTTTVATAAAAQSPFCNPITSAVNTVPAATNPISMAVNTVPAGATTSPQTASLPFTGIDIKPLLIGGTTLLVFGLALLTTVEQRRLALRYAGVSSTRFTRWLLGD